MPTFPPDAITADLVRRLVAAQHPRWADLPVTPVPRSGWDNRSFRLGDELLVRLPSAEGYVDAVAKEQHWLPLLAPHLPLPVPEPVAAGVPGEGFPWPWSVYRWLPGEPLLGGPPVDRVALARDLAAFLGALRTAPGTGPGPGQHNWFRGGPVAYYDDGTRAAIAALGDAVDGDAAAAVWEGALASTWQGPDVWFHGDVADGNLLVRDGRLAAVIDFGTSGFGDPACDLVAAWTLFDGASRAAFREAVAADDGLWARARGWALWKALITLQGDRDDAGARTVLEAVLADAAPAPAVAAEG